MLLVMNFSMAPPPDFEIITIGIVMLETWSSRQDISRSSVKRQNENKKEMQKKKRVQMKLSTKGLSDVTYFAKNHQNSKDKLKFQILKC